jgi:hypothetical protein
LNVAVFVTEILVERLNFSRLTAEGLTDDRPEVL